jgi:hypothetical protein
MNIPALTFLMVFSFNASGYELDSIDLTYQDDQEEIVQVQDLEPLVLNNIEKTIISPFNFSTIIAVIFIFDSFSFSWSNGKISYTFSPAATAFKWVGSSCQFLGRFLYFLKI